MSIDDKLRGCLDALCADDSPGGILCVSSERRGLSFAGAKGDFARGVAKPLTVADGFRIASMSKTFTAVVVLQLSEVGQLELDQPLGDFLDVSAMPVAEGHYRQAVTLRRLLNHTAGLSDFAMSREWGRLLQANPGKFRAPADILAWAFAHTDIVGPPGGEHHYSDTGYVALGLVIEAVTGQSYGDNVRRRILAPLGMNSTWLEGYESPRSTLSHTYSSRFDGLRIHGSCDWAAGGHVSTGADLALFMRRLFAGELLSADSLAAMQQGVVTANGHYGLGVAMRVRSDCHVVGHNGFWGSFMAFIPELDLTVTGTGNYTDAPRLGTVDSVVEIVAGLQE